MKIIRKGKTNWMLKPIRFSCPRCQCAFEADNDEYTRTSTIDHYGGPAYEYQTECPNCHLSIIKIISEEDCYDDN